MPANPPAHRIVLNLKNESGVSLRLTSAPIIHVVNEYDVAYVDSDYTLVDRDFWGFRVILIDAPDLTTITIPKVGDEVKRGRCVNIGQETDNQVTILAAEGVSIHPHDALVLRREGSFATLIYEGADKWRFIGELP